MERIAELRTGLEDLRRSVHADLTSRHDFEARVTVVLERLISDLDKINSIVLTGNGQESITVRLGQIEQRLADLSKRYESTTKMDTARRWQLVISIVGWILMVAVASIGWLVSH